MNPKSDDFEMKQFEVTSDSLKKVSPVFTTARQCNEWNKAMGLIERLERKNERLEKEIKDLSEAQTKYSIVNFSPKQQKARSKMRLNDENTKYKIGLVCLLIVCFWLLLYLPHKEPQQPVNDVNNVLLALSDCNEYGEVELNVRYVQALAGVTVDGIIGPETMKRANEIVMQERRQRANDYAKPSMLSPERDINEINIGR